MQNNVIKIPYEKIVNGTATVLCECQLEATPNLGNIETGETVVNEKEGTVSVQHTVRCSCGRKITYLATSTIK